MATLAGRGWPLWPALAGIALVGGHAALAVRRPDPAGRASLDEALALFVWVMAVLWGVLPLGWWGRRIGIALLALTGAYALLISPRRHGDTLEDRGLGSWPRTAALLTRPEGRPVRAALLAVNATILVAALFAPDASAEVARGALHFCLGVKLEGPLPAPSVALGWFAFANALGGVVRWDNLPAALRIVGLYVASLALGIAAGGYLYVYAWSGGWMELDPLRGATSMITYVVWGLAQELLFLGYFNTRIRKGVTSGPLAALLTSVVFSLFHLKAYTLTLLCFLVMHVWALIFQAAPNLFALAVAHGISGGFGRLFEVRGMTMFHIKASVGPFNP